MIQDHKSLDKTLISPAFLHFFAIYPPFIKNWARRYYNEIGINFVSLRKQKEIVSAHPREIAMIWYSSSVGSRGFLPQNYK